VMERGGKRVRQRVELVGRKFLPPRPAAHHHRESGRAAPKEEVRV
jgi:hypothetical protein